MRMRILLVEDTPELRRLFARLLRHRGFEVFEVANGQEALDRLATCVPDVVLTDLMMPVLDGFTLIRRIRAITALDGVPVLAMTGTTSAEAEREARVAGAVDVLAKPLDGETLVDRIGGVRQSDGAHPDLLDAPTRVNPEGNTRSAAFRFRKESLRDGRAKGDDRPPRVALRRTKGDGAIASVADLDRKGGVPGALDVVSSDSDGRSRVHCFIRLHCGCTPRCPRGPRG
jgi:two-component system chemotaxis response regulator CheY